jgi:septal ring factor EnvC (AmiA/AmiB activator)
MNERKSSLNDAIKSFKLLTASASVFLCRRRLSRFKESADERRLTSSLSLKSVESDAQKMNERKSSLNDAIKSTSKDIDRKKKPLQLRSFFAGADCQGSRNPPMNVG